jgi:predicted Zn-dependent peptidase
MEFYTHRLKNGMQIIHKQVPNMVAHAGVMIEVGSRDELEHEEGLSHFIEHCLFKGTQKRKAFHVLSRLEDVGGELNAFTSKEDTFIYSSFIKDYYERTVELFHDVIFNSNYPIKELEKEKDVIVDEINSYKDSPSEQIFDDFDGIIFEGDPLGKNVLGTEESIDKLSRKDILHFTKKFFQPNNMIFSSIGDIQPDKLFRLVEKYFGHIPPGNKLTDRKEVKIYKAQHKVENLSQFQTHCMLGTRAYGVKDERRKVLVLLNNLLGGPGLNSRLNMGIREKYGFAYSLESNYHYYSDTGVFSIYFGTDEKYLNKVGKLVTKELNRLMDRPLGVRQLDKAKRQLIGQIAIGQENHCQLMQTIAKSYFSFGKVDSLDTVNDKIWSISDQDILMVANDIFNPDNLSTLIFKQR